jgi:site-specific recombinase XerC
VWEKGGRIVGNDDVVVPNWHPHQLRHSQATEIRRHHGIDAAQEVLGHTELATTEVYAETDREKAKAVMMLVG